MATDPEHLLGGDETNILEAERHLFAVPDEVEQTADPAPELEPSNPAYWERLVADFYDHGDAHEKWAYFSSAVGNLLKILPPKSKVALLECLSDHPDPYLRLEAAERADVLLANTGEEVTFKVVRSLVEQDDMALDVFEAMGESKEKLPRENIVAALGAASTKWWERRQGLIEDFREISGREPKLSTE